MIDILIILLPAFILCLLLVFSHVYLGLHVLERGIIFVDLALAQVAAFGVSMALILGYEDHGISAKLFALGATLIAAFGFAKLRELPNKITREVTIGCVYVVTTSLTIVFLSQSSVGMEELKHMLNGNILWVSWEEITVIAIIYIVLGIFHYIFRKNFLALSFENDQNKQSFIWEFLFFATFAVVITLAVNVAGVLMVFAFLIIPAFSVSIFSKSIRSKLLIGWLLGILGTIGGLAASYALDLPTGATVVSIMGLLPIIGVLVWWKKKHIAS